MVPEPPSHPLNEGQQNRLLQRLVEDAPIGIAYLEGAEQRVVIANPALYQFFPNRGELVGQTPAELIPELADIVRARIARVFQTGEPFGMVDVLVRLQQDDRIVERYFTYMLTPVRDENRQIKGVLCTIRELTEEVRARQALEFSNAALSASEERTNIAQEAAEIGVWEWDARTNQVWWSPRSYVIYGYQAGQPMTLETSLERVDPEDVGSVYEKMRSAIRTHTDFRIEYRIRHPERGVCWVEGFARIVYAADGQAMRMIGTVRDITTRKKMEVSLRETLERERSKTAELAAIMDAVPAMVLVAHDPASRFIDGNRTANEMLQVRQGTNLSKTAPGGQAPQNFHMMRDGKEIPTDELPVQLAAAKGIALRKYGFSLVLEDGAQTDLIGNVTPLFDSTGQPAGAVAAFVDITGKKQVAEELSRLNKELKKHLTEQDKFQKKLQKLIDTSNRVIAAQSVQEMLQTVIDAAVELTEARAGVADRVTRMENSRF